MPHFRLKNPPPHLADWVNVFDVNPDPEKWDLTTDPSEAAVAPAPPPEPATPETPAPTETEAV